MGRLYDTYFSWTGFQDGPESSLFGLSLEAEFCGTLELLSVDGSVLE